MDYRYLMQLLPKAIQKKQFKNHKISHLQRVRLATSLFFFCNGFTFATWASRIPAIKTNLQLSEAALGTLLFTLPVGQLLAMPISGKVIAKYGAKNFSIYGTLLYSLCLIAIGFSASIAQLAIALFFFGFISNFCNIAVNTLGVHTQQLFDKPIMGSFHGSWSLAGFFGALVGLLMLALHLSTLMHFVIAFVLVLLLVVFNAKYCVQVASEANQGTKVFSFFKNIDKSLVWLGILAFCCMASEGIMYDWSGVYFKEIVKVPGALVILGYATFMVSMTIGRFLSDYFVQKFGPKNVLLFSGITISSGLFTAVFFPFLIPCTLAFMFVGFGVSNVVPIIFSRAGLHSKVPTSIALTVVSSISFLGFLIGPPLIGVIAEWTSLRYSFASIGFFGLLISLIVSRINLFK
jgi:MFS family permease